MAITFKSFDIPEQIADILEKEGYVNPSKVQLSVIPAALRGESLLAQSPTGTGKTHSFLVPILSRVDLDKGLQALIIAPTRELARQTYVFAAPFIKGMPGLKIRLYSGENERADDLEGLSVPPQIAIGTPGRLLDLLSKGLLSPKYVKTVVLDEADMLLDMGFFDDAASIVSLCENPQVLVFSATLKEHLLASIRKFAGASFSFMGGEEKTAETVGHHFVDVRHANRGEAAAALLKATRPYFSLVFVSKKEEAGPAMESIKKAGFSCVSFTGDLSERERKKTMRLIKEGRYQVVVASDLLSRGIDLPDVSSVISLSLPNDFDFYFHRAGRSGRFGKAGDSYILYDSGDAAKAKALLDSGLKADFLTLRNGTLKPDPVGLLPKKKLSRGPKYEDAERREIAVAKARSKSKERKPGYKKKQAAEVEKIKRKYRRKAIKKAIRKQMADSSKKGRR